MKQVNLQMERIKNLAEYRALAARTLPDLGSEEKNFLHMEAGMTGEFLGEVVDILKKTFAYGKQLDTVHLGEELADTMWYVAGVFTLRGKEMDEEFVEHLILTQAEAKAMPEIKELEGKSEREKAEFILGIIIANRNIVAGHDVNMLVALTSLCSIICDTFEIDFYQALTNNIAKLKVRYPEKYSDEAAINRDTDAERKELEK